MDDEKKIDSSDQRIEHSPPASQIAAPVVEQTEGFSFKRLFHNPDHSAFYQEALDKYGEEGSIDPAAEKKLVRRLDMTIIPILGVSQHPSESSRSNC